jgi:hypothetical protein
MSSVFARGMYLLAAMAAACAAQPGRDTLPRRYECEGTTVTTTNHSLAVDGKPAPLARRERDGNIYIFAAPAEQVEYRIPEDPHLDATVTRSGAPSRLCMSDGGYTDALLRFIRGWSIEDIAHDLGIEEGDARERIHTALMLLRCRFSGGC